MNEGIDAIVQKMTLEEKAGLCSGLSFWFTKGIDHFGIPSLMLTDGPHGLRKQDAEADHLGLNASVPSTCFPSAAGMAASWNRDLIQEVGEALGKECQAENVSMLLGPGTNIKRSPLCGRNFEYFSEDPYLSSEMATHHIRGVQSQGVGTSLKHFAANNQEHRRLTVDVIVDERTLREIYLASFEGAVKQSQPWSVMSSYNKVNGEFASENEYLLMQVLRKEWRFEGFVVSDWGAVNERVPALRAGMDLEMPPSNIGDEKIVKAVKQGGLTEECLDQTVKRILAFVQKWEDNRKEGAGFDREDHHLLARKAAAESMVLLKNEDRILPLRNKGRIAVIGQFAKSPRYQGGGSSHVNPTILDDVLSEMKAASTGKADIVFAPGYSLDGDDTDASLLHEAKEMASIADVAVLFVGLPESYESEGYDRVHMSLPANHVQLIEAVAEVQRNVVVILSNGAPVEMPWVGKVKAVLEGYLAGQAFGGAVSDLLFGFTNPSGKLAETFPVKLEDNPSFLNFPGEGDRVEYREGIFVGYRYYDAKAVEPLFPFGHGLSYTEFEYSELTINKESVSDTDTVKVTVKIKNIGSRAGQEIVQLYVRDKQSTVVRPDKELKGFYKIALQPEQEEVVEFMLDKRSFAYYNVDIKDWHVESGMFEILIGKSSRDIVLKQEIEVISSTRLPVVYNRNTTMDELMKDPRVQEKAKQFARMTGFDPEKEDNREMMMAVMKHMPLRSMINFGQGKYTEEMLAQDLKELNELTSGQAYITESE